MEREEGWLAGGWTGERDTLIFCCGGGSQCPPPAPVHTAGKRDLCCFVYVQNSSVFVLEKDLVLCLLAKFICFYPRERRTCAVWITFEIRLFLSSRKTDLCCFVYVRNFYVFILEKDGLVLFGLLAKFICFFLGSLTL